VDAAQVDAGRDEVRPADAVAQLGEDVLPRLRGDGEDGLPRAEDAEGFRAGARA
jgi:hypothetical protein